MHWVQAMHSICRPPSRMSMPVGQVVTQRPQSMQSPPVRSSFLRHGWRGSPARFVIADDERLLVEEHRLEAAVGAGEDAGLFAEPAEIAEHEHGGPDHDAEGDGVLGG